MPKYYFLSHKIEKTMPSYGKKEIFLDTTQEKSISKGDSCNISSARISSHLGTHVDCPCHFFKNGKGVSDYPAGYWVFKHPFALKSDLAEDEVAGKELFFSVPQETDIVLLKSGFQRFRGKRKYNFNNPGVSAQAAFWLRANRPNIRVLGVDFISISPFAHRETGRQAHKAFLDPKGENLPILLLEDMDLQKADRRLVSVQVFPLRVSAWDSAPCTAVGEIKDSN